MTNPPDRSQLRIPLPQRAELADEVAGLLDLTAPAGGRPPATIAVLTHQPGLLGPFLGWAAALALSGVLSKRDHELVALRAAWNCRSAFEWGEHVGYARSAGLTDDEIDRVALGEDAPGWTESEAVLLRAVDELHTSSTIADGTWAALADRYDPAALVEILFVAGQYTMLSMVANAVGAGPEPGWRPMPPSGRPGTQ